MAASRFTKDSDVLGISAKACDVVFHPPQRFDLIEHAVVAGATVRIFLGQFVQCEETPDPKTIVYGYLHDTACSQSIGIAEALIA